VSTHDGSTSIYGGNGNDRVDVTTIGGHTLIDTGNGNDTVNVGRLGLVNQIAGLLTIDTGAGSDTVNVDNSAAADNSVGTLTASTLTGLSMPTVGAEQTLAIRAASGTYLLSALGFGTTAPLAFNLTGSATRGRARQLLRRRQRLSRSTRPARRRT